mmetsp:Transcript_3761/g.14274  ORF Transcript_3761/g.14274 Transcript_3761/m.14274 type:complete len:85 (-) Transcript_3761:446-700(-)
MSTTNRGGFCDRNCPRYWSVCHHHNQSINQSVSQSVQDCDIFPFFQIELESPSVPPRFTHALLKIKIAKFPKYINNKFFNSIVT